MGSGGQVQWTQPAILLMKVSVDVIRNRPYHSPGLSKNERFHHTLKVERFALRRFGRQAVVAIGPERTL